MIQYKCVVQAINLTISDIKSDKEYYYDPNDYDKSIYGKFMRLSLQDQVDNIGLTYAKLKINGLNSRLQGAVKIKGDPIKLYCI